MPGDHQERTNAADVAVQVVLFDSKWDNVPKPWSGRLGDLLGDAAEVRPDKETAPGFSGAVYREGATRGLEGVEAVTLLILDYDHISGAQFHQLVDRLSGKSYAIYSSYSDRAGGEEDRCLRVIIILARPVTSSEFRVVRAAIVDELGVPADETTADPSRFWFAPSSPPERASGSFITYATGTPLDPALYLALPPVERSNAAATCQPATSGQVGDHATATPTAPITISKLKARLRKVTDPESRELIVPVLSGTVFAEPGSRNDALWRVMCIAAFMAPEASPETLVELVQPSLATMAATHPEGSLSAQDAAEMATRALRRAADEGVRIFERGDEAEIAGYLLDDIATTEPAVYDENQFWIYDPTTGLWTPVEDDVISRKVQRLAGAKVLKDKRTAELRVSANVVRGARDLAAGRACRRGFFEGAASGFVFTNGFVRVDESGLHLEPHSPDHKARSGYPFPFDPEARAPRFEQLLQEVFAGDPDAAQKTACLQEFNGNVLVGRATKQAKAIVVVGEGRNGKSTVLEIMSELVPENARESVPPQYWENEYFRERLKGKLLNVVPELPKADILRSEAFKAIVAGDPITARAIRQAPIRFRPVAGHIFAANALPAVDDASKAFWARVILITFNNEFTPERGNVDTDVASYIINHEMPGLALWALQGAARLLAHGSRAAYTVPASHHAALAEWRLRADQVAEFVAEMTVPATVMARRTPGRLLYDTYSAWAKREGHRPMASNTFGARVKALGVAHVKPDRERLYAVALTPEAHQIRQAAARRGSTGFQPDPVIPSFHRSSSGSPWNSGHIPAPQPSPTTVVPPGPPGLPPTGNGNGSNGSTPHG